MSFPTTHLSLLHRIRSADVATRTRARDALAAAYWTPVYAHIRLTQRIQPADAEDLTQGFFAEALRRDLFARYEPARARFRTYLRTCVDSYVANSFDAGRREKRGGNSEHLSLDAADIERRLTTEDTVMNPDTVFHREWVRAVLTLAVARLRGLYQSRGRTVRFQLFECYEINPAIGESRPTYAELARRFGIPPTQVTNWLAAARRDFRAAVLDTLRDLSTNDAELREDARALLGIDVQ